MSMEEGETIGILGRWKAHRHVLGNGLTVLLVPDPGTPLVSYQTWYRVGSRDERPGKTGLAHMMEHLLFGATKGSGAGDFDRELERLGAETNASTWLDFTCFHETFPPEALGRVLELEAGRMAGPELDRAALEREIGVIANERRYRVEDSVDGSMDEALYRTAFRVHPYGNATIGSMEDIRGITIDDCREFHAAHYATDRCMVVVAGAIEPGEALGRLEAGRPGSARRPLPADPPQDLERRVAFRRAMPAPRLAMGYRVPGIADPSGPALVVLCTVLAGGETGRLVRRLVHETEAASSVSAWTGAFEHQCLLEIRANMRRGRSPFEAIEVIDEEARRIAGEGPTAAEVASARNRARLAFHMGLSTASGKAYQAGFFECVAGGCGALAERIAGIEAVDEGAVAAAARAHLATAQRTAVVAEPEGR